MCGIWVSIGLEPSADTIDRVAHRGPDDAHWLRMESRAGPIVLAHRRLSIFDLDVRSRQPMSDPVSACTIVFNGAIYNFRELRQNLERIGRVFHTSGDTEVLLAAYAEWGPQCLERLNGMFAFLVHDPGRGRLFAARDRFGVKPLYVWAGNEGLAFASEIKQLIALSNYRPRIEESALRDFLAFGITDHGGVTCFAGIR